MYLMLSSHSSFLQTHNIDNYANIGIRGFTTRKQKIPVTKCYYQWVLYLWTSDCKSNTKNEQHGALKLGHF